MLSILPLTPPPAVAVHTLSMDLMDRFVVVRDPADRLLSGFLNKCAGGEWQNCPYVDFMPDRFGQVTTRNEETDKVRQRHNTVPVLLCSAVIS